MLGSRGLANGCHCHWYLVARRSSAMVELCTERLHNGSSALDSESDAFAKAFDSTKRAHCDFHGGNPQVYVQMDLERGCQDFTVTEEYPNAEAAQTWTNSDAYNESVGERVMLLQSLIGS
eukprot:scaffold1557_cov189-Alexandrium_tamarense.AAC.2